MPGLRTIEDCAVPVSVAFVASASEKADFAAVMAWLAQQGHTGPITVHLLHGMPKSVDFPREPQRILLER
jgi:hypothetical protein